MFQILYQNNYMKILIWEQRAKKKCTLEKLSKKTNISKSALNYYENEEREVSIFQLEKIAEALECKITDLFESDLK